MKTILIKAFDSDSGAVSNFEFEVPSERVFDELKHRTVTALGTLWPTDPASSDAAAAAADDPVAAELRRRHGRAQLFFNATLGDVDGIFHLRDEEHVASVLARLEDGDPIGIVVSRIVEGERQRAVLVRARNDALRGVDARAEFVFKFCPARPGTFAGLKRACVENLDLRASTEPALPTTPPLAVDIEICAPSGEWTRLSNDLDTVRCLLEYALDMSLSFVWVRAVRAPDKPKPRVIGVEVMFQGTIAVGRLEYTDSFPALVAANNGASSARGPPEEAAISASPPRPPPQETVLLPEANVFDKLRALCLALHDVPETTSVTLMRAVTATEQPTERPLCDDAAARDAIIRARATVPSVLHLRMERGVVGSYPSARRGTVYLRVQIARDNRVQCLLAEQALHEAELAGRPSQQRINNMSSSSSSSIGNNNSSNSTREQQKQYLDSHRVHTIPFEYDPEQGEGELVARFRRIVMGVAIYGRPASHYSSASGSASAAPAAGDSQSKSSSSSMNGGAGADAFVGFDPLGSSGPASLLLMRQAGESGRQQRREALALEEEGVDPSLADRQYTFWVGLAEVDVAPFTHPAVAIQEGRRADAERARIAELDATVDRRAARSKSASAAAATTQRQHDPVVLQRYVKPTQSLQSALTLGMIAGTDSEIAECLRVAFEADMPVVVKLAENQPESELFHAIIPPAAGDGAGGQALFLEEEEEARANKPGGYMWAAAQSQRAVVASTTAAAAAAAANGGRGVAATAAAFDDFMAGFSHGSFSQRESELRALAQEWEDVTGGADNTSEGGGIEIAGELLAMMLLWNPQPRATTPPNDGVGQQQEQQSTAAEDTSVSPNKISSGGGGSLRSAASAAQRDKDNNQTSDIVHHGAADAAYGELMTLLRSLMVQTRDAPEIGFVADPQLVESLCDAERLFALLQSWTHPLSDADVAAFTSYCRAAIAEFADVSPTTRLRLLLARAFRAHSSGGVVHAGFLRQTLAATMADQGVLHLDTAELDALLADYQHRDGSQVRRAALLRSITNDDGAATATTASAALRDFILSRRAFDEIVTYVVNGDAHAVSQLFSCAAARRPVEIRPNSAEGSAGVLKAREAHLRHKIRHAMDAVTLDMCVAFAAACEEQAVKAVSPPDVWTRIAWAVAALLRNPLAAEDGPHDCSNTWRWLRRVLAEDTSAGDLLFALRTTGWSYAAHDAVAQAGEVALARDAEPRLLLPVAPVLSSLSEWCRCVAELTCIVNRWSWPPVTSDCAATARWGRPGTAAGHSGSGTSSPFGSKRFGAGASPVLATTATPAAAAVAAAVGDTDVNPRGSPKRRALLRVPVPPTADPFAEQHRNRQYAARYKHLAGRSDYSLTRETRPTPPQLSAARREAMARAQDKFGGGGGAASVARTVDLHAMLAEQQRELSAMRDRFAANKELTNAPPTKSEISKMFVSGIFEQISRGSISASSSANQQSAAPHPAPSSPSSSQQPPKEEHSDDEL